jgi:hypothetical protein
MIKIGALALLSMLLIMEIVSCRSAEPIPADKIRQVDYIVIWYDGKSIKLENENKNCSELYAEIQRAVKVLYVGCPAKISVIDSIKQNEKCLELIYKDPRSMLKDIDYIVFSELVLLSKETSAARYITYVEHSSSLEKTKSWEKCWSYESRNKLAKKVDTILATSH